MIEAQKILIIEDDQVSQRALIQVVQTAGYNVVTAADSAEAITTFELERPDLLLVDINLSGETFGQQMDGLGVIDWLNYRHPDHPIKYIIVSADDPDRYKGRAAAIGASSFVRKPIDPDLVLSEIKRAIGEPTDPCQPGTPHPELQ